VLSIRWKAFAGCQDSGADLFAEHLRKCLIFGHGHMATPWVAPQGAYRHANLVVMVVMVRYGLFRAAPPGSHWRDWFPSHRGDDRGFVRQLHGRRLGGRLAVEAELHGRTSATSLDGTPAGVSGKREGEAPTGPPGLTRSRRPLNAGAGACTGLRAPLRPPNGGSAT